ncbi:hypothetical protein KUL152_33040 [Tenacibaculum sp. KUL152]|nr:hypothetical protein KUL152_33040 [Tenacibaculum sp. KUL152]
MIIESADTAAWNIAEGLRDDKPILIRYRPDLDGLFGHPSYSQRLVIFWDYVCANSTGLPNNNLLNDMREFEDSIVDVLDKDRLGIFVYSYTHSGTKEWHFYVSNIQLVSETINNALASFPKLPIELQVIDDPQWDNLKNIYAHCK